MGSCLIFVRCAADAGLRFGVELGQDCGLGVGRFFFDGLNRFLEAAVGGLGSGLRGLWGRLRGRFFLEVFEEQ
jgi:hypothetical protein